MRNLSSWCLTVTCLPATLCAQVPRETPRFESWVNPISLSSATGRSSSGGSGSEPHAVQWYEAAAVAGAVVASGFLDETVRTYSQDHRTETKDDIARVFKHMGQPEVYATVGLGTILTGLIASDDDITRAGGRITGSLVTAGLSNSIIKYVVGRTRPNHSTIPDPDEFEPFSGNVSFPSGHTAMAFALAASVSNEVHFLPAQIGLYSAATLTGWSRINDNAHWLSDVLGGAAVGITSAMIMDGRWTIFGLGQPHFLATPNSVSASMSFSF
ncbi:MAG TPA: phosphatase PAP2 family protein [Gemmatimonadales bacterium]|nr:phosphatase PAP2 family protein [Gemmatimonadales bacterium]